MEYYNGSIKGKIEELEKQNKKLILTLLPSKWRQSSHVQMTFKPRYGKEHKLQF